MDPITIGVISVVGFLTLVSIFEAIFYAVNTYKQTQAQKTIAESTKEGVEIQRSSAHSQSKIAENTSNLSSQLKQTNQTDSKSKLSVNDKKSQSQLKQR